MAAWRYKISLLVLKKYFTRLLCSLVKYFSTLEEKFVSPHGLVISSILSCYSLVVNTKDQQQISRTEKKETLNNSGLLLVLFY